MSMEALTVLQCLAVFLIYTGLTLALPAIVIYPKVRHCRAVTRFFFYFSIGNFYLMNLVYFLQILHISYWPTLVAGVVIPSAAAYGKFHDMSIPARFSEFRIRINRVASGSFGLKNWLRRGIKNLGLFLRREIRYFAILIWKHLPDCLFLALTLAAILGFYGVMLVDCFGYGMSDVTTHNYWINAMGKNNIFAGGVYPFGFHNIIYFIHAVFGIDTFVLMRVFWLVQTVWIHLVLLMLLKGICKSRFLPYAGTIIYAIGDFSYETYRRYYASLPQEFGMVFILPAVYFAFEYFRIQNEEFKDKRRIGVSKWYLMGFAMNFAMSFSAHFYDTIILGVFCVGIAIGYIWRFAQPRYFSRVVRTCIIALAAAVLPLAAAAVTGTPLEGSLRWGISIMKGAELSQDDGADDGGGTDIGQDGSAGGQPESGGDGGTAGDASGGVAESGGDGSGSGGVAAAVRPDWRDRLQALRAKLGQVLYQTDWSLRLYIFGATSDYSTKALYAALLIAPVLCVLFLIARKNDEAFALMSVEAAVLLMIFLLIMPDIGLPMLMQQNRSAIFLAYFIPIILTMAADGVLYFLLGMWRARLMRHVMNAGSLAALAACLVLLARLGMVKPYRDTEHFQTNGAITCLTNIIRDEKDLSWTIVSAFDEMRLGEDHGFHTELTELLNEMEHAGAASRYTIPTKYIFFFIEKNPIPYALHYSDEGQPISEEGAKYILPHSGGLGDYQGMNRWIIMSRFNEWAKTFQSMYPNDMSVYYEDDELICYRLEQNPYHLYNLCIDYGYNN